MGSPSLVNKASRKQKQTIPQQTKTKYTISDTSGKMRSVVTNRVFLVTESFLAWGCGVRRKKALQYAGNAAWVISNMVDEVEESGETEENASQSGCRQFKTPMELFQDKKTVRVCAPMVRYSK